MIKLFRKIRQKMLSENKFSKYLLYAIGEIVLVVIGILIALQINNWNEDRIKNLKEQQLLNELHKEFSSNLKQFNEIKQVHQKSFMAANIVIRNFTKIDNPISLDSLRQYGTQIFSGVTYNPSSSVVQSALNSGDYQLIKNDSLRKLLTSWKEVLNDYVEEEIALQNFWTTKAEPFIIKNGDFTTAINSKNFALLKDPVFKNIIARRRFYVQNVLRSTELEVSLEAINNLLTNELQEVN